MQLIPIEVVAYAGYRADETPRSFKHEGIVYDVVGVDHLALELLPDGRMFRRFKVQTCEGDFQLAYEEQQGRWFLIQ